MIKEIRVKNYALLDDVSVNFEEGFNVLTGSTGTGKSILIKALSLLLGEKGDVTSIRKDKESALVEGTFSKNETIDKILNSAGIESNAQLLIRRIVKRKGGGSIYINNSLSNLEILNRLGKILFDIHGQHEHQRLLDEKTHVDFIDAYGKLDELVDEVAKLYYQKKELHDNLTVQKQNQEELEKKKELFQYQKKELDELNLTPKDYNNLKQELKILKNYNRIENTVSTSIERLSESEESIVDSLSELSESLKKAVEFDDNLADITDRVNEARLILQDTSLDLSNYLNSIEFDRDRLEELENLINRVEHLKRKFNCNYTQLIKMREELEEKLSNMKSIKNEISKIEQKIEETDKKLQKKSEELSKKRKKVAETFTQEVINELDDLGFNNSEFKVSFKEKGIDEKGQDNVSFLFAPNPGEGFNALSRIASGGELSRVMLALKSILSDVDRVEGLVFDEIDTGIGGSLGGIIGKKMREIGEKRQVLCVTHLPSMASRANHHITVIKENINGRTVTSVQKVNNEKRIMEIARMLSGNKDSKTAIKHAEELLKE